MEQPDQPKRKHAILSPSGAAAWMLCARKPLMEKGLPDDANEYSDEGTCAHAIAARALTEGEPVTAYVGFEVDVGDGRQYVFREDMAHPVQVYVDLVRTYHASLPGSELHVEVEVPIGQITGEEGATGTADAVVVGAEEIIVIDLKFGMGVEVSARNNPQAMFYALGAVEKLDAFGGIRRVRPVIVQPRITEKPSEWDCTIEELRIFEGQAAARAAFALDLYYGRGDYDGDRVGLAASEKACRFCRAKATCPAFDQFVVDTAGVGFEALPELEKDAVVALVPGDLEALGRKFHSIPILELFCKAVRAKAESVLFESQNDPAVQQALGIKIVMGKQGNREWKDDGAVETILNKKFRLKRDLICNYSLKSPTQMEKVLAEHGKPKWIEEVMTHVTRSPGKPSVAPLDDRRPPLDLKPSPEGFEALQEEEAVA